MIAESIFLYGPPGVGKSTLGARLAAHLGLPFIDLDSAIETASGRTVAEIFRQEGEPAFRERESQALRQALQRPAVIALGGGTLLREENRHLVESQGRVLLLWAEAEVLEERLQRDSTVRPLLDGDLAQALRALLERRRAHYRSFPLQLEVAQCGVDELLFEAQARLGRYRLRAMGECEVYIGPLQRLPVPAQPFLVTDRNLARYHMPTIVHLCRQAGRICPRLVLPPGEGQKTLRTVMRLWHAFLQAGLDRQATILALGGGVVGDLAGFAAATYLRGVAWYNLPTSLLAMADASLGGKTGFDLPQGKNLIGAFHAPQLVIADPTLLETLPLAEWRAGLAEVVKHGIIGDPALFSLCCRGLDVVRENRAELLRRAMAVKIRMIEEDPYERGRRAMLNLGHTLGHALEAASGYRMRHGEAVAIGMVAEARLAVHLGLAAPELVQEIATCLKTLGLPTTIPARVSRSRVLAAMGQDKKRHRRIWRFALPLQIGRVEMVEVSERELPLWLETLQRAADSSPR